MESYVCPVLQGRDGARSDGFFETHGLSHYRGDPERAPKWVHGDGICRNVWIIIKKALAIRLISTRHDFASSEG